MGTEGELFLAYQKFALFALSCISVFVFVLYLWITTFPRLPVGWISLPTRVKTTKISSKKNPAVSQTKQKQQGRQKMSILSAAQQQMNCS